MALVGYVDKFREFIYSGTISLNMVYINKKSIH